MKKIKLGFAPTRRSIFSAPDAVKYRGLTAKRLEELGVDSANGNFSRSVDRFRYLGLH